MAAAAILEKSRNRHILAAIWQISMKFDTATHFDPLELSVKIPKIYKSKMAAAAILEIENSPYIGRGLTVFDEMWHGDALSPLRWCKLRFQWRVQSQT